MDELQLVQGLPDIIFLMGSVQAFNREAPLGSNRYRAKRLIGQTTYWVHYPKKRMFGPSKFVAFRRMNFNLYKKAIDSSFRDSRFDGYRTRTAIETALGRPFRASESLSKELQTWAESLFGEPALKDTSKWKFISLETKREASNHSGTTSANIEIRKRYWFTIQDPRVLEYDTHGLWIHSKFRGSYSKDQVQVGDEVAIYEPEADRMKTRQDGAKAVVALARVEELEYPWVEEDDEFVRVALAPHVATDKKGVPAAVVAEILEGRRVEEKDIGLCIHRYAVRIKEIGKSKYGKLAQYFVDYDPDEEYQRTVEEAAPETPPNTPTSPHYTRQKGHLKVATNGSIGSYCLSKAGFKCEVDPGHATFISQATNRDFVETHHLIPLQFQLEFEYALDNHGNIVALCPNCHRLLHLAKLGAKREHLAKLLNAARKRTLKELGTPVTLAALIRYYG